MPRKPKITRYPENLTITAQIQRTQDGWTVNAVTDDGAISLTQREPDRLEIQTRALVLWLAQIAHFGTGEPEEEGQLKGTRAERKNQAGRSPFTRQGRR